MAVSQDPGGGGGGWMARLIAMPLVSLVMTLLLLAIYQFAPHHEAKLRTEGPAHPKVLNGVWEETDFFGLVDTQWTLRGGRADGEALQFYPNGSLFRELYYLDGRLNGPFREYYEKERYRRAPVRGRLANRSERAQMAGALRKEAEYRDGTPDGPYRIYDPSGRLKEEGLYRSGVKDQVITYGEDGRPRRPTGKEDAWTQKL